MAHINFKEEEQDFKKVIEENKSKPTFVDFYAEWCGPCKVLKPMVEKACKDNDFNWFMQIFPYIFSSILLLLYIYFKSITLLP
jgi:thiol-disulfide isomerase/thioredoxin